MHLLVTLDPMANLSVLPEPEELSHDDQVRALEAGVVLATLNAAAADWRFSQIVLVDEDV
jgi:hypothetical protein